MIVVRHPDNGKILAFQRSDTSRGWQLPQGGLEAGEEPIVAAWRELMEETGLGEKDVTPRSEFPEWIAYEWPDHIIRDHGRGQRRGQVQRWFVFEALHADITPQPDGSEFHAWRWATPGWIVSHVVEWRRPAYERVLGTL